MQSNSHIILASGLQLPAAGAAASARPSQHQLAPAQAQSISDRSQTPVRHSLLEGLPVRL